MDSAALLQDARTVYVPSAKEAACIGTGDTLYYCFPKTEEDVVAKTRLAAEELYKISKKAGFSGKMLSGRT